MEILRQIIRGRSVCIVALVPKIKFTCMFTNAWTLLVIVAVSGKETLWKRTGKEGD